jgi:YVTN family beta-propeller protein
MSSVSRRRTVRASIFVVSFAWFAACTPNSPQNQDAGVLEHTLFVASEGALASYNIQTGEERQGTVTSVAAPVNMQALEDGTVMVNLTGSSQILAIDGNTMLEKARLASSGSTGTRPVHSFVTPTHNGKRYWVSLNDGANSVLNTNSARFLDADPNSPTFLQPKGEVALGIGHHKAAFSNTRERAVISNIADCGKVLAVYDYSDIGNITEVKAWSALDLGWDETSPERTCRANFQGGAPVSPHGCATSKTNGKIYCNLTSSGEIASIDVDAETPSLMKIATAGSGAGYTKAHPDGRYIYSLQEKPREGEGGVACQSGQLVIIDGNTDTVVQELPLLYNGPSCTTALASTDEGLAEPGHIVVTHDKNTLYIGLAGAFGVATARVRRQLVVDITNPANGVQQDSIAVGASTGHHDDNISGDGRYIFVANNIDNTVSRIDTTTRAVTATYQVRTGPQTVATFGTAEGPSHMTGPIE